MPVETGYKPSSSEWKEGQQYKKRTNKPEVGQKIVNKSSEEQKQTTGNPEIIIKDITAEKTVKSVEEGEEGIEYNKSQNINLIKKRQERLQELIADYEINGKAEFFGSKAMEETYNKLKLELKNVNNEITSIKKELPFDLKEVSININELEKIANGLDDPKEKEIINKIIAEKKAKLNEGKEIFINGEISPETKKKDQFIEEVAFMAVNPQDNKNMLENNHIMSYTKYELENILNQEPDPEKRAQKLKEYLVGSLDQAITLRNEAKYGSGFMGKVKKFLNQGWGGAIAKTAAGAGLIAGGLFTGMGIFSPIIYGAGLRMASEGITQIGQEINEKFNKNSRENLLKQGKTQLEQQVNAKIVEFTKNNPELKDSEKVTQMVLEFVDKTYAKEIQTLVEQDSSHLQKTEKFRRYAGWVGGIGGMVFGIPMDIDADGISHFVKFINEGKWMQGIIARNLGHHLWTQGSLANFAGFGAGSMVTYMLNRGAEGDERTYKFNIRTTRSEQETYAKAEKETAKNTSIENLKVGDKIKEETIEKAQEITIDKEKIDINKLVYDIAILNEQQLKKIIDNKENSSINILIAELNLVAKHYKQLEIKKDNKEYKKIYSKNILKKAKLDLLENKNLNIKAKNEIIRLIRRLESNLEIKEEKLDKQEGILNKEIDKKIIKDNKEYEEDDDEDTFRKTQEILTKKSTTE